MNISLQNPDKFLERMEKLEIQSLTFLERFVAEDILLIDFTRDISGPASGFCKQFSREFGQSPMRWLTVFRCLLAWEYLNSFRRTTVRGIGTLCGFNSHSHFSKSIKAQFGSAPSLIQATDTDHQFPDPDPKVPPTPQEFSKRFYLKIRLAVRSGGFAPQNM